MTVTTDLDLALVGPFTHDAEALTTTFHCILPGCGDEPMTVHGTLDDAVDQALAYIVSAP